MKYIVVCVAGLYACIALVSCKSRAEKTEMQKEDVIPVKLLPLKQETMQQIIYASGQFSTDEETNLSFKSGGIIGRVLVKEGDAVKKGQLLATLNLTEINAAVEQASLAYQKAQRDYERAGNLYRDSVATLEQMQNAKTAMEVAKQQYASAGFNQRYAEIRAPRNGYVLKKYLNDGQYASSGTPVIQVNGAGETNWILKAGVSDYQWAAIHTGDKATVSTDALPGKLLNAVVIRKPEGVDPVSGTFIIHLKLTEQQTASIASGLFGKAAIQPSHAVAAWAIPYDALLDGDASQGYVFVTNDNVTAQKVKVQVEKIESGKVIIASGLENAKSLIVSGSAYLDNGSAIKVIAQ
ncbi:MAG: efflux RND transporter periplasmic adaptor subunit [Chitinophagaceae bacterium]|nr:efflux RND transporter periplasmic adaptor subunit [Chitinophagaceae bacterium]